MYRKVIAVSLVFLLLIATTEQGITESIQDDPEAVSLYSKGKRYMREGNWLSASRTFEELAGRFPASPNIDLFLFNRAKSQYHFGEYSKSLASFSTFLNRFPNSEYFAHARFFGGNIYYLRGRTTKAVAAYFDAYARSTDKSLTKILTSSIVEAIVNAQFVAMDERDFKNIDRDRRCKLIKAIAKAMPEGNMPSFLENMMSECGMNTAGRDSRRSANADDVLDIAAVLPLSGELQSFGEEIYRGALLAADLLRLESNRKVKVTPYDSEGDPVNVARIIAQLIDSQTDLIIGPLTSEEAAVGSAVLDDLLLPLIAPAATETGLTLLSPSVFQLSPNIELQGIQMADYAALTLGAKSAVVIASTEREFMRMTNAFVRRFESYGGIIVATQFYRPREKDFGNFIRDIKSIILGITDDSTLYVDENGVTYEPDGLIANVDCLFIPGNERQLRLLLPQVAFYNLHGQLLGSDGWGNKAVYALGDNITNDAVFPSPFLQQQSSPEHLKFASLYDNRYGKKPPRLAALGYDAVMAASHSLSRSKINRETLRENLSNLRDFKGAAASITFGPNRENIDMPLYRISNGEAIYLGIGGRGSDNVSDSTDFTEQ